MARRTRVVVYDEVLQHEMSLMPGVHMVLEQTAERVKAAAVEASPVGVSLSWPWQRPMRHGLFKKAWSVRRSFTPVTDTRGKTTTGVHYMVYNDDEFAAMIEFGTVNNPAYAAGRRATLRFGGTIGATQVTR